MFKHLERVVPFLFEFEQLPVHIQRTMQSPDLFSQQCDLAFQVEVPAPQVRVLALEIADHALLVLGVRRCSVLRRMRSDSFGTGSINIQSKNYNIRSSHPVSSEAPVRRLLAWSVDPTGNRKWNNKSFRCVQLFF